MIEDGTRSADRLRMHGATGPDDAARILLPVAEALAAMHAAARAHGALSPAAIDVDDSGRALLRDPARLAHDPLFAPPGRSADGSPGAAADVWSFAAVLLLLTTGRPPARGEVPGSTVTPRDAGWLTPLIQLALSADPRERPTMADVVDYLRARVPGSARRRASSIAVAVAGAALVIGLGAVGAALLVTGSDDPGRPPSADDSTTQGPPPTEENEEPTATASAEPVDAKELETFARRYVATASRDPGAGFRMLTASYQRASPRYREVWSAIQEPRILALETDPRALSVSYTYRYTLPSGERRTEDITLRLVERRGRLLIAGASAR